MSMTPLLKNIPTPFLLLASDEAGRGPLAGPVVACTVGFLIKSAQNLRAWEKKLQDLGVRDSKQCHTLQRQKSLESLGINYCVSSEKSFQQATTSVGSFFVSALAKSAAEIDQLNILKASLLAMGESGLEIARLESELFHVLWLIDGPFTPLWGSFTKPQRCREIGGITFQDDEYKKVFHLLPLIKGDQRSAFIALASLMAKEMRDFQMSQWHERFPQYGFAKNQGYPTQAHREALKKWGPSPAHRLSYSLFGE
jgi:ribonuclease HII